MYFRDAILPASESDEDESEISEQSVTAAERRSNAKPPAGARRQRVDRQKLIIILVGLPGRGKTFLCNKLMCYLNWCAPGFAASCHLQRLALLQMQVDVPARSSMRSGSRAAWLCQQLLVSRLFACRLGHETRHFNVGSYRRKQRGESEVQNADLFDHKSVVRTRLCFLAQVASCRTDICVTAACSDYNWAAC